MYFSGMLIRKRHALRKSHVDYCFFPDEDVSADLDLSITRLRPALLKTVKRVFVRLRRGYGLKLQLRLCLDLEKFAFESRRIIRVDVWFPSDTKSVLVDSQLRKQLSLAIGESHTRYDAFVERGSGWTLRSVKQFCLSVIKYKLFGGGCDDVSLPSSLHFRRCCFSVESTKRKDCFLYAVAASLLGRRRNRRRRSKLHDEIVRLLPSVCSGFPVGAKEIKTFEASCPVSVNVYGYERKIIFPYYLSTFPDREPCVNLLLYRSHYFCISNLSALISSQLKINRRKVFVCRFCLSCFASVKSFENHRGLCRKDGSQFQLPSRFESQLTFQNYKNMVAAPFVVYCDMETMISNEEIVGQGKTRSRRRHLPASVGAITVCRSRPEFGSPPFLYTGKNCVDKLLSFLLREADRTRGLVEFLNVPCRMTKSDVVNHRAAKRCKMCHVPFSWMTGKVRDHCHLSGRYRFPLCSTCNLTRAKVHTFSLCVIFHGLTNYDSHFIIQRLNKFDCRYVRVIPRNSERYLSFSLGPLQFKDSYQFLPDSLSSLASNLVHKGTDRFRNLNRWISGEEERSVFRRKGVFPYSYFCDWSVLKEDRLPKREAFKNDLDGSECSLEDYNFAQRVWDLLGCHCLQDYLEIYLKADILLLADCFENFRDNCMNGYELDPVHYFSTPHFTFDAFMRHSKISLELFSDVDMYLFVTRGIRGGLSMVSKRYSKANNKYLPGYDPDRPSKFIMYLDANNLYGRAMQEYLPLGDFQWMSEEELVIDEIMKLPYDGPVGCIVECTVSYPPILHDWHSDYPLAPVKTKISYADLSPIARVVCDQHKLRSSLGSEKLLASFRERKCYVLHYRALQLYVRQGLVIEVVHRGLRFTQAPVMKDYVDMNSRNRARATNKFDVEFYKLLSNSLYGKTIENPEKRTQVKLCNSPEDFCKNVSKYNFKQSKIINRHLAGVELRYPVVKLNKPFSIGMSILDLSKLFMYDFHYNVIKRVFGSRVCLLYTDTDSLLYEIQSEDVYAELSHIKDYFDFSNYPLDHFLYSEENKRIPGAFKDECASRPIAEFVGLRSKMYSFKVCDQEETKVAKGVKKSIIKKDLKFESYVECLNQNVSLEHSFKNIRSASHSVFTWDQRKVSLSPFDDKRYLVDMVRSLPYGHFAISEEEKIRPGDFK